MSKMYKSSNTMENDILIVQYFYLSGVGVIDVQVLSST